MRLKTYVYILKEKYNCKTHQLVVSIQSDHLIGCKWCCIVIQNLEAKISHYTYKKSVESFVYYYTLLMLYIY